MLVVEDDWVIRMHAILIVEAAGYEALEASDADKAIEVLDALDDRDLVFTDI